MKFLQSLLNFLFSLMTLEAIKMQLAPYQCINKSKITKVKKNFFRKKEKKFFKKFT